MFPFSSGFQSLRMGLGLCVKVVAVNVCFAWKEYFSISPLRDRVRRAFGSVPGTGGGRTDMGRVLLLKKQSVHSFHKFKSQGSPCRSVYLHLGHRSPPATCPVCPVASPIKLFSVKRINSVSGVALLRPCTPEHRGRAAGRRVGGLSDGLQANSILVTGSNARSY